MSSIARYLSSVLSHLTLFALVESVPPPAPRTPRSSTLSPGAPSLARGLVLSTSPYLKSAAADPKVSLTPAAADAANSSLFDFSLSGDTSTSSSCSDDTLITPLRSLDTNDLFSPRRLIQLNSSFPKTPSPPHLVGLGISGVPRRDGKPGDFDGYGLVGIRRSFNLRNPSLVSGDDDEDDDGYASPTPAHVHSHKHGEQENDAELSETFMRELVFTWESDPQHTRALSTIPECDDETELEFQQIALKKELNVNAQRISILEPTSPPSSSSSFSTTSLSSPSPFLPQSTSHITTRPRVSQALKRTKSELNNSRTSSRSSHSHTRSRSCSPSTLACTRGRTITRAKDLSGLSSGQGDGAVAAPSKKKLAIKGAWRA